ncbi:efflux RND transporter permease subunit [soil metagenome]
MNISAPFIRRPIGTSLLAFGLLLFGGVAYFYLPIAPLPQVDLPTIGVSASLPGVDPATAASSMAAPLERRLGQIPGVTEMTSNSSLGSANVTVQFDLDRDVDDAARDVQAGINASVRDLPANLPNPPTYRKWNPADSPVIILAMTSKTMRLSEVYNLADQIVAQRLLQMPGVSQVGIYGGAKTAVRVQVNPSSLASMGLSMEDVRTFLQSTNRLLPKGSLQDDDRTFMITANDQLFGAEQYRNLIIAERNGVPVRLGDIANVIDSNENLRMAGWFNRDRAVLLPVMKQSDANVIAVVDQIKKILPQLREWVPPGVEISVMSDRTQTIRASVHDVQLTLTLTVGLVTLVMGIFLRRFWPTFIAGVTVPLALAATFGVMWLCSFSLDNISLMALTVAVGFLVDDAIVVIENIVRHLEQGDEPKRAALAGARQIGFTVVSMSLSLVAVFLPILLMGGIVGRFFHEFAVTLSAAILVSAVISLTLTPTLCGKFLKRQVDHTPPRWDVGTMAQELYAKGLRWVLRNRFFTQMVTLAMIALTVWLYTVVPKGFFPQQDTGLLIGTTDAAQDISFGQMVEKQRALVDILLKDPAIVTVGSFVGSGGRGGSQNNGRMFITLKPNNQRALLDEVIGRLRHKTAKMPGITLYLYPVQDLRVGGRSGKAQYQYSIRDADLQELNDWAPKLLDKLRKVPGLEDVNSDQQFQGLQTNVVIDRDAAGRLGIQPAVIDSTLYSAFGQRQVSIMYGQKNQYRVILEADPNFQEDANALNKIFVTASGGKQVPLSAIAHYERVNVPLSVNHEGQFAAVTISFNLAAGVTLDDATVGIERAVKELHMPDTLSGGFAGNAKAFKESTGNQLLLYLASILAVYIVLGMLYESLIHPITILSTLPSAGLGALLALLFTGMELSIVASIGIILLIGIVKKNAIMMVDFALEAQRDRGSTPEEAIYEACLVRFRPIMMTTLAALFGSLPLAIGMGVGSELRKPLGVAIVGGLIVSQTLTLFTTPVIYLFMEKARAFVHKFRRKKKPVVRPVGTSVA